MTAPLQVRVWNEGWHETRNDPATMAEFYPKGIHGAIAAGLIERLPPGSEVTTALLTDPDHGLSERQLAGTDVLVWWGHMVHEQVSDAAVDRVQRHVLAGMGLIVLHSGHLSKILLRMLGTTNTLSCRNDRDRELIWTVDPAHPIAAGIPNPIIIPEQEVYGEFFDVPPPDELIFISSFAGGEVFRSGMTYRRGRGRIFYFSPGDQDYPVYQQDEIRSVITNAVRWAYQPDSTRRAPTVTFTKRGWFQTESPSG